MNFSSAVMLINPHIRAIKVAYDDMTQKPHQTLYTFKTLDNSIKVDDMVVIPSDTRHKMTTVKVVAVDVEVDFDSDIQLGWVISRVDTESNAKVLTEETKWIEQIKAADKRKKREQLKQSMLEMYQADGIDNMAIANMSDVPAVEAIEHKS